jgi:multiple antibiotic resistance protein
MTFISAVVLLFLVLDPLGNVPLFISATDRVQKERRKKVILRESLIAYVVLVFFFFCGRPILRTIGLDEPSLSIAGGVILFLIALKMVFPERNYYSEGDGEPFIVPLAIPLIAGPSAIATVLLFMTRAQMPMHMLLLAITCSWAASTLILVCSSYMHRFLGERGLAAVERLMGLVLTAISIQMLMTGISQFLGTHLKC